MNLDSIHIDGFTLSPEIVTQIYNEAPCIILIINKNGQVRHINASGQKILNIQKYDADLSEIITDPIQRKYFLSLIKQVCQGDIETFQEIETAVAVAGSDNRLIEWKIQKTSDELLIPSILAIGYDITTVKVREQTLRSNELVYRDFFENDITGEFLMSNDGHLIEFNPAFQTMFKMTLPEEIERFNFFNQISNFSLRERFKHLLLRKKRLAKYEFMMETIKGNQVFVKGNFIYQEVSEANHFATIRGYLIDVTDKRKAEFTVRDTQILNQRLIENAQGVPYILKYDKDQYEFMGEGIKDLLEFNADYVTCSQIRAAAVEVVLRDNHGKLTLEQYIQAFKNSKVDKYQADMKMITHSGKIKWISDSSVPIIDELTGKIIGSYGILMDITDRKVDEFRRTMIYKISEAVHKSHDIYELYQIIHQELNQIINSPNFFIGIFDKKSETISLPFMEDGKERYTKIPAGKTLSYKVLTSKESLILREDDILRMAERGEVEIIGTMAKVWMGVPLIVDDEVIGLIVVQNYSNHDAFSAADMDLIEFLSEQIAASIRHKQIEDEVRKLSRGVEQAPVSIMITDTSGTIGYANTKIMETTGYEIEELIGQNPNLFKSGFTSDEIYNDLWKTISHGEVWRGTLQNVKKMVTRSGGHSLSLP